LAQAVATLEHAHGAGDTGHVEHADHPPSSTGLDSRKLLMWLFLASDCMFFGSLIAMYMIYRGDAERMYNAGQGVGPVPHEILDIPYTSISAFVLLMSSLTMVLALASIQRGNQRGLRVWLGATAALGLVFLGGQFFEFTAFYREGLGLTTNIFSMSFFTLTGFHGAHVTIGVIWLISLVIVSLRGGVRQDQSMNVEIAGLYWHFVDIVWIVIFTLVYLIPYDNIETVVHEAEEGFRLIGLG
jgi:cytochrome c oxidase subunit 3/cytochrome o ubiquinol oxidase subunit 3